MKLPRLHLFEFLDQTWLPAILRRYLTDYLVYVQKSFGFDRTMAGKLAHVVAECDSKTIVDLGSGGGGPILALRALLAAGGEEPELVLTDLHPESETVERFRETPGVAYRPDPIDATAVPRDLVGLRTVINALHHLRPEQVRAMLADAAAKRQPLVTFDVVERSVLGILSMLLVPPIIWLLTPFLRPLRGSRFLLTYVIPIVPLLCTWDGLVSQLRAYSPRELEALLPPPVDRYRFEVGKLRDQGRRVTYLIGQPIREPAVLSADVPEAADASPSLAGVGT